MTNVAVPTRENAHLGCMVAFAQICTARDIVSRMFNISLPICFEYKVFCTVMLLWSDDKEALFVYLICDYSKAVYVYAVLNCGDGIAKHVCTFSES